MTQEISKNLRKGYITKAHQQPIATQLQTPGRASLLMNYRVPRKTNGSSKVLMHAIPRVREGHPYN